MATIQDMTESYLSQADKLELSGILSHGEDNDNDDDDGGDAVNHRLALTPAEYARTRCAFRDVDAIRNGLSPSHVRQVRRSLPIGWAW